ncbi:MAG: ribonuclease HI [Anaerolineae bacterium]|jgi:ribonuclease HI|nr:ribonuclease HI [Anaerolineae bacterium]
MGNKTKNYYVVANGHKPGIYTTWTGENGAASQVQGFPKALYKGFATREEAISWLINLGRTPLLKELYPALWEKAAESPSVETRSRAEIQGEPKDLRNPDELLAAGMVVIFTDGSALGNPGPGGYGIVLRYKEYRKELSGGFRRTTNNRMELLACIKGLEALKTKCPVVLYSDSRYVVNGITLGWAKRWRARGWYRTKTEKAENYDLWARLLELCEQHPVSFRWVKGHAGSLENERCDELATTAARQPGLPPDVAYERGETQVPG